ISKAQAVGSRRSSGAAKVCPVAINNTGRKRLPPANTLQRIASWIFSGGVVAAGNNRSSSASTRARLPTSKGSSSAIVSRATSEAIFLFRLTVVRLVESTGNRSSLIVAHQYLDAPFRLCQTVLAFPGKPDALLKQFQTFF